jgi:mannonate dehydratase
MEQHAYSQTAGSDTMRAGLATFFKPSPERLRYIKQLGVDDVILWGRTFRPSLKSSDGPGVKDLVLSVEELLEVQDYLGGYGLRLHAIENLPFHFYDKIIFGKPGREKQMEYYQRSIENIGKAGIPYLGYNWIPFGVKRTSFSHPLRGGAQGTAYDDAEMDKQTLHADRVYGEEEFWDYYAFFIQHAIPVAEAAGVKMSLHPNDPPVEKLGGVPYLFRNMDAYRRGYDLYPSGHNGVILCLGNLEAMGEDIPQVIAELGRQGRIHYVHFQSTSGTMPRFHEEFIDTGDHDPWTILTALRKAGFEGVMIPGHVPQIEGDIEWSVGEPSAYALGGHMGGHRSRAFAIGMLRGLIHAINQQSKSL